jgi:hypothetical protein
MRAAAPFVKPIRCAKPSSCRPSVQDPFRTKIARVPKWKPPNSRFEYRSISGVSSESYLENPRPRDAPCPPILPGTVLFAPLACHCQQTVTVSWQIRPPRVPLSVLRRSRGRSNRQGSAFGFPSTRDWESGFLLASILCAHRRPPSGSRQSSTSSSCFPDAASGATPLGWWRHQGRRPIAMNRCCCVRVPTQNGPDRAGRSVHLRIRPLPGHWAC